MLFNFLYVGVLIIVGIISYYLGKGMCRHIWRIHDKSNIILINNGGSENQQRVEVLICENCGEIVRINLTTGDSNRIICGGARYKEKLL